MRTLKRLATGALALGLSATGIVMTAPLASAHTGTLTTSAYCQDDGTVKIVYSGETKSVPTSGPGHVATLTIGEVQPAVGSTIAGNPSTVTGNAKYTFTQTVPGTTTYAQATAFLKWGDGAKSDPIGKTNLPGNCKPKTPVSPSGDLSTSCYNGGGQVAAVSLSNGTASNVSWQLVTGTSASHATVVAGPVPTNGSLVANGLPDATVVWLQVKVGNGSWADEGSVITTGKCTPVAPSGALTTDCVSGAGRVTATNLDNGTATNVSWRLVTGSDASHTTVVAGPTTGSPLVATGLADGVKVWLQVSTGNAYTDVGSAVTTGKCAPVAPTGALATDCVSGAGRVTATNLDNGTAANVSWRLVSGTNASHTTVVAGPTSGSPLVATGLADATKVWLQVNTGNGFSDVGSAVTTGNCTVVPPSGSFTVVCSATGATVTIGTLGSGTNNNVVWTLDSGSTSKTVSSGDVVAVPALSALALKFTIGGDSHTVQSATAPAVCAVTGERSLDIVKAVSPTGDADFGDTLTYTLKVTAGGNLGQSNVVVSDYIPGYKPGRDSGKATYVPGSAGCDAGTCSAAYDSAAKQITWGLGDMAPGTSRTVTFQVTIDTPVANADSSVPATTIFNSGAVCSTELSGAGCKPSNEVETPVTAVLGVKLGHKPPPSTPPVDVSGRVLPHTGAPGHLTWLLGSSVLFLLLGTAMIMIARKPEVVRVR